MNSTSLNGLSLRVLEYVSVIAAEGNFGRAASICGVSQPAISQQILKLEERLGFAIFERQGRCVSITEGGDIFLQKADGVLAGARELVELSSSLKNPMHGEIRIGVIPTLGPYLMPLILRPIKSRYPNLKLSIVEEPTDTLERYLLERKLDIVLLATEPDNAGVTHRKLFFEPYVYVCPEDRGRINGETVHWGNINESELLMLSVEHCMRNQTMVLCNLTEQPGQRVASSLEMLRQMVALSEGSALMPMLSVSGVDRFQGLLTLHPIEDADFGRTIGLNWRASDPRTPYLSAFADYLAELAHSPALEKNFVLEL